MKHISWALCGALALATPSSVPAQTGQGAISCGGSYTVARGDSLSAISARAYGTLEFRPLYTRNAAVIGRNPNLIRVGQVLEIPCLGADGAPLEVVAAEPAVETLSVASPAEPPAAEDSTPEAPETGTAPDQVAALAPEPAPAPNPADDDGGAVVLTFNRTSAPPFIINSGIIDPYFAEIEAVTEGRVRFTDPATVSRVHAEQFDRVVSGEIDGAYVLNSDLSASHPLLQLPMLPLMGGSAEQTAVSLWRLHETHLARTNYFSQARLLGFVAAPAAHIWRDIDVPVTADEGIASKNLYPVPYFQGLDTRGPAKMQEDVARWMATYSAENEAPPTFFLAHGAARALGLWTDEVQVTEVDAGLYTPTFSVILSNAAWARISPEDQAAILAISGEALSARSASWDAFDNGFRADMLANGLKFVKADDALLGDLRDVANDGIRRWTTYANALGIPASRAITFYMDNLRALEDRLLFR